jgi:hypothetical protein
LVAAEPSNAYDHPTPRTLTSARSHPRRPPAVTTPGGTVARAKRTDRAEARRRNRAILAETEDGELETTADEDTASESPSARAVATRPRPTASGSPAPAPRPGITSAFRASFRPLDLRGDLRALPQIVTHWSLFVPVILAGLAVALVPFFASSPIVGTLFGYFSGPAPFVTAFIAGLFAPRASYLVGILVGLASVSFMALAFAVGPFGGVLQGMTDVTGQPLTEAAAKSALLSEALVTGVPLAAIVAAAGAWYRRFLNRANPNRTRPSTPSSRRPDGKVPKKPQQRPMLARRR